jgi:4-amino-4-deoxy-L-arabinose transferase-like glycosyltransferase
MKNIRLQALALFALTAFLFWWRLDHLGLIDPDEPFYAQTTREMVQRNDWTTPYIFGQPQFEKPIFFYWQTMLAQKIFGDNELAARAPSALFATALVFLVWIFGRKVLGERAGFFAALVLATGMIVVFMARLMLTDISLAFFITAALYGLWMAAHDEERRDRWVIFQFVMSGLATLTKGPIGVMLPAFGGLAYLWLTKTRSPLRGRGLWIGLALWAVIVVPWYAWTLAGPNGAYFWEEFFYRDNYLRFVSAEHPRMNMLGPIYVSGVHFYPEMLLLGMLPWLPLALATMVRGWHQARESRGVLFVICAIVPSLLFITAAQSKLPSYGFFLYPPFALLMGHMLGQWWEFGLRGRGEKIYAGAFAVIQAVAPVVATLVAPKYADAQIYAMIIGVPLAVAAVLLIMGQLRAWAVASVAASVTIIAVAFTGLAPQIEGQASSRIIGTAIRDFRRPGEPVLTVKFMVRSVAYYNHEDPAAVFAGNAQPWFSPHPIKVLVSSEENGFKGLSDFLAEHGSAIIAAQPSDLRRISDPKGGFQGKCEKLLEVGDRVLFRVTPSPRVTGSSDAAPTKL